MRKDHENKLTALKAVDVFFDVNAAKIAVIVVLARLVAEFKTLLAKIISTAGAVDDPTSGKTQIKYDAEDELIAVMLQVGPAIFAYANEINDAAMRAKSNFSKTSLRRMRDMELVTAGKTLYKDALLIVDKLGDYGVSAEIVADLNIKVGAYEKAVGEQGSGVSQRSTAIINVAETFRSIDKLFTEKIDPLMQSLEKEQPALYREYKQTRLVKYLGVVHKDKPEAPPANPSVQ